MLYYPLHPYNLQNWIVTALAIRAHHASCADETLGTQLCPFQNSEFREQLGEHNAFSPR